MIDKHNRFFHGYCDNKGNHKSRFRFYIIETIRNISDYNGGSILETVNKLEDFYFDDDRIGEPFYAVFGSFKIDFPKSSMLIGTFENLSQAIDVVESITGNYVTETEQPVYRLPD